jgi:hypothetical protein
VSPSGTAGVAVTDVDDGLTHKLSERIDQFNLEATGTGDAR